MLCIKSINHTKDKNYNNKKNVAQVSNRLGSFLEMFDHLKGNNLQGIYYTQISLLDRKY